MNGLAFLTICKKIVKNKNYVSAASLKNTTASYTLSLVNSQGKLCSRCIFNSHCYGCIEISPENRNQDKDILLQINDTIAITFDDETINIEKANAVETQHESMSR